MFWVYGGRRIIEKTFPDGEKNILGFQVESTVNDFEMTQSSQLTWKWESDADFITLMLLKRFYPNFRNLRILFLPYSREDRGPEGSSCCSLRYIGEFIQQLGFESIQVFDPHSDLTLAYLGTKAFSTYPIELLRAAGGIEDPIVMFPDAGAAKRYGKLWGEFPQIVGNKVRDFKTGKITGYSVECSSVNLRNVIIVDDLCSYGGTFMAAGKALREHCDPHSITLIVTHCERSIFKGDIFKQGSPINHVLTTDSLLDAEEAEGMEDLTVIELSK
jgi:ribose-phosphate pyrophosphokinase